VPLEILTARASLLFEPVFTPMCSSGKDTTGPEFVLLLPFSPVRRSNRVGWLAGPQRRAQLRRTSAGGAFRKQRLLLGPSADHGPDRGQDPQISFQFGLWNPRAPSCAAANLLVLPVGECLLLRRADLSAVEEQCLAQPCCGVVGHDGKVRDGAPNLDTALAKLVSGTGPAPFPGRNPNGFLPPRFLDPHPRLKPQAPNLTPNLACPPPDPVPVVSSQRRAYQGICT